MLSEALTSFLNGDVDQSRLEIQLLMIPDMIKTAFDGSIKKVTMRTLSDAMNKNEIYKGMLSEVDKLLRIYFMFPVTSATAERAFSSLRRIKTFLRSTMTHCRLNNLFLLYVHTDVTDNLDLSCIAKEFVSVNSGRIILERFNFLYCTMSCHIIIPIDNHTRVHFRNYRTLLLIAIVVHPHQKTTSYATGQEQHSLQSDPN